MMRAHKREGPDPAVKSNWTDTIYDEIWVHAAGPAAERRTERETIKQKAHAGRLLWRENSAGAAEIFVMQL